ncbi:MAG: hypothetical protein OIF51_12180 [Cellvibrionaceae bacterium]|nr:hypothetical protein [Cellvibrionaceae bacterium]
MKSSSLRLAIISLCMSVVDDSFADITGSVFNDYNANGVDDGANEPPIADVMVSAYGVDGAAVGNSPQFTDSVGEFNLTGIIGPVRLEFTLSETQKKFLFAGAGELSQVIFAEDGDNIDLPLHNPSLFCHSDPDIAVSCFVNGDSASSVNPSDTVVAVSYLAANKSMLAAKQQTGAVWGLAYQRDGDRLFMSSMLKRHSALGPAGEGVIYVQENALNSPAAPSVFSRFSDHGISVGAVPSNSARGLDGIDPSDGNHDALAIDLVGKVDLGGVSMADNQIHFYTVNLHDRAVYRFDSRDASQAPLVLPSFPNHDSGSCVNGVARPWAVKAYQGDVYLGVVCSAENGGTSTDLSAAVYRFDGSNWHTAVPAFALDYPRQAPYPGQNGAWQPWGDEITDFRNPITSGENFFAKPSPILSDIEFDDHGNMLLNFSDRTSLQMGGRNLGTNTADTTTLFYTVSGGELLRATALANKEYQIEVINIASDEFFSGDEFLTPGEDHLETAFGGLAVLNGADELVMTALDPERLDSGGLYWLSTADGSKSRVTELYRGAGNGFSGKSTSLGDSELICEAAPLQLGNRVWCDQSSGFSENDGNGIQDPGEAEISAVTLRLSCGAEFAEVQTDIGGQYLFTDSVWSSSANTSSSIIPRYSNCTIAIDMQSVANINAIESVCGTSNPTLANANSGEANARMRDSNGVLNGQWLEVNVDTSNSTGALTTGRSGQNDHSFDFGFAAAMAPTGPSVAVPLMPWVMKFLLAFVLLGFTLRRFR